MMLQHQLNYTNVQRMFIRQQLVHFFELCSKNGTTWAKIASSDEGTAKRAFPRKNSSVDSCRCRRATEADSVYVTPRTRTIYYVVKSYVIGRTWTHRFQHTTQQSDQKCKLQKKRKEKTNSHANSKKRRTFGEISVGLFVLYHHVISVRSVEIKRICGFEVIHSESIWSCINSDRNTCNRSTCT